MQGAVKVSNTSYTMTMDRGRSFQIDREDNDETGVAGLAGQVMGEFIRTRVAPEMDAYILSKLAKLASDKTHTVTATLPNEAVELLTDGITKVQACVGYDEPLVAFVNSAVYGLSLIHISPVQDGCDRRTPPGCSPARKASGTGNGAGRYP